VSTGPDPSFVVREWALEPSDGFQVAAHVHHTCEEAFYVLEGEIEVMFDGESRSFQQGMLALVERGTAHTFRATGNAPSRVLAILTPEVDRLISALHQPGQTAEQIDQAWQRANSELAG
jgi:mannose-6-phosphate isomerase-like protein (cupin superfamily)